MTRWRDTPEALVIRAAYRWDVDEEDVYGGVRSRRAVAARRDVARAMRSDRRGGEHRYTLEEIREFLGYKSHTSVLYLLET